MFKCSYWKSNIDDKPYEKMLNVVDKIIKKTNHNLNLLIWWGMGISIKMIRRN